MIQLSCATLWAADLPKGWRIEERLTADLNQDGKPDEILKLVEDKPDKDAQGDPTERERALQVNLAGGRSSTGYHALICTRCGGAFFGMMETPANLRVDKRVLIVEQEAGAREITRWLLRFWHENGRIRLIGADIAELDRATGRETTRSTNYLTGDRIETIAEAEKPVRTKKLKVAVKPLYLEDVVFEKLN
jgi:hypothetical protein